MRNLRRVDEKSRGFSISFCCLLANTLHHSAENSVVRISRFVCSLFSSLHPIIPPLHLHELYLKTCKNTRRNHMKYRCLGKADVNLLQLCSEAPNCLSDLLKAPQRTLVLHQTFEIDSFHFTRPLNDYKHPYR